VGANAGVLVQFGGLVHACRLSGGVGDQVGSIAQMLKARR